MAYTAVQGVLLTFRRRLAPREVMAFADQLPAVLRALFVAGWDPESAAPALGAPAPRSRPRPGRCARTTTSPRPRRSPRSPGRCAARPRRATSTGCSRASAPKRRPSGMSTPRRRPRAPDRVGRRPPGRHRPCARRSRPTRRRDTAPRAAPRRHASLFAFPGAAAFRLKWPGNARGEARPHVPVGLRAVQDRHRPVVVAHDGADGGGRAVSRHAARLRLHRPRAAAPRSTARSPIPASATPPTGR